MRTLRILGIFAFAALFTAACADKMGGFRPIDKQLGVRADKPLQEEGLFPEIVAPADISTTDRAELEVSFDLESFKQKLISQMGQELNYENNDVSFILKGATVYLPEGSKDILVKALLRSNDGYVSASSSDKVEVLGPGQLNIANIESEKSLSGIAKNVLPYFVNGVSIYTQCIKKISNVVKRCQSVAVALIVTTGNKEEAPLAALWIADASEEGVFAPVSGKKMSTLSKPILSYVEALKSVAFNDGLDEEQSEETVEESATPQIEERSEPGAITVERNDDAPAENAEAATTESVEEATAESAETEESTLKAAPQASNEDSVEEDHPSIFKGEEPVFPTISDDPAQQLTEEEAQAIDAVIRATENQKEPQSLEEYLERKRQEFPAEGN